MSNRDPIYTTGGPFLLAPLAAARAWGGSERRPTEGTSDYESLLAQPSGWISEFRWRSWGMVVLDGEPLPTSWYPNSYGLLGVLVRWFSEPERIDYHRLLESIISTRRSRDVPVLQLDEAELALFDAAAQFSEVESEHFLISIGREGAFVDTAFLEFDGDEIVVHRFLPK